MIAEDLDVERPHIEMSIKSYENMTCHINVPGTWEADCLDLYRCHQQLTSGERDSCPTRTLKSTSSLNHETPNKSTCVHQDKPDIMSVPKNLGTK